MWARDDVELLCSLERQRCRAISELDLATLRDLLNEDLSHTHVPGHTEDRQTYLRELPKRPRVTEPGELVVRQLGEVALMTGTLRNTRIEPDGTVVGSELHALRVWHRSDNRWTLVAFAGSGPL